MIIFFLFLFFVVGYLSLSPISFPFSFNFIHHHTTHIPRTSHRKLSLRRQRTHLRGRICNTSRTPLPASRGALLPRRLRGSLRARQRRARNRAGLDLDAFEGYAAGEDWAGGGWVEGGCVCVAGVWVWGGGYGWGGDGVVEGYGAEWGGGAR